MNIKNLLRRMNLKKTSTSLIDTFQKTTAIYNLCTIPFNCT